MIKVTYPDECFVLFVYQGNLPCCPGNLPGQRGEAASLGSAFICGSAGEFTTKIHLASEGGRLH